MKKIVFIIFLLGIGYFNLTKAESTFVISNSTSGSHIIGTGANVGAVTQTFLSPSNGTGTYKVFFKSTNGATFDFNVLGLSPAFSSLLEANNFVYSDSCSAASSTYFPVYFNHPGNSVGTSSNNLTLDYSSGEPFNGLQAGKYYKICIGGATSYGETVSLFGNKNTDSYNFGKWATTSEDLGGDFLYDLNLNFTVNGTSSPYYSTNIDLVWPENSTYIPDFQNWVINITNSTTSIRRIGVKYTTASSSFIFNDSISYSPYINVNPLPIWKSYMLVAPPNNQVTWYAYAYGENELGEEVIASSIKNFIVAFDAIAPTSTSITLLAGSPTFASGTYILSATENCQRPTSSFFSAPGDNLAYGLCSAGQFLFTPSDTSQAYINTAAENMKSVFPFNIFFSLKNSLSSAVETVSSTVSYDLYMNWKGSGGSSQQFPILTSSTLENAVGSSTKNMVFTGISSLLWLGLGYLIITTIL